MALVRVGISKLRNTLEAIAQPKASPRPFSSATESIKQILWNLGLISLGSVICAVALNGILIPNQFLSSGVVGFVLVIHYLLPDLQVSVLYLLFNVPIFALGWMIVGRRFLLYSVAGALIFSIAVDCVQISLTPQDKILAALLAGIITGAGSGVILKSLGSAGGLDILSVILLKKFSIRLGTTILVFNSILLALGAMLFSIETALYTLIYVFVTSYVLNFVVMGLSQRKAVLIISPFWREISKKVLEEINRGLTIFPGRGGYTEQEEQVLYTVVSLKEVPQLKRIVRDVDSGAFVVIYDTREVMGNRIGNQPHW